MSVVNSFWPHSRRPAKLELDFAESQETYLTGWGHPVQLPEKRHEYCHLDITPTINRYPRALLFFLFERNPSQPSRFFAANSFVVPTWPLPPTHYTANCECSARSDLI